MQPKEQGVLMWKTEFELQFLLLRKHLSARSGANSLCKHYTSLFGFGLLQCQVGGVCSYRQWNHNRQFRQLIKVFKLNLVYVERILCCLNKLKHLRANTKQYLEYLLIRVQDLRRVTPVHAEVQTLSHRVNTQARITYSHTYGQFRLCT